MKYILSIVMFLLFFSTAFTQHWEGIVNVDYGYVSELFVDEDDDLLYIGGSFKFAVDNNDTINARGIMKWDGQSIENIGFFPNSQCNNFNCDPVRSITKYKNEIYANIIRAGHNEQTEDILIGLARWNGVKWDSVGAGVRHGVLDQIVYKDELYVMGRFQKAGNMEVHSIAKWDGIEWHDVLFPYVEDDEDHIDIAAATIFEDELYVAGNFWSEDGSVKDVAKYDGENWYPVGNGVQGGWDDVGDIIVYQDEIYICGDFKTSSGNAGNKVMKLVNNEWTNVGVGLGSTDIAHKMIVWDDNLYVFGVLYNLGDGTPISNIAIWDGEMWCGSTIPMNNRILKSIIFRDSLYIGGGISMIDNQPIRHLAKWIGGSEDLNDLCQPLNNKEKKNNIPLNISPNPTQGQITITFPEEITNQPATLHLYNTLGNQVWSQPLSTNNTNQSYDFSMFPSGMYLVEVVLLNAKERMLSKLIIGD